MEQYIGIGRRKASVARVYLRPGKGRVTVNGKTFESYFGKRANFDEIMKGPMRETQTTTKFDVVVRVAGGGTTGQVEAIRLGIARSLEKANPDYRPSLKKAGFLTRDARCVERKKYGQPKARKRYQFSKR